MEGEQGRSHSGPVLLDLSDGGTKRDLRRKLAWRKQQGSQTAREDHFLVRSVVGREPSGLQIVAGFVDDLLEDK